MKQKGKEVRWWIGGGTMDFGRRLYVVVKLGKRWKKGCSADGFRGYHKKENEVESLAMKRKTEG